MAIITIPSSIGGVSIPGITNVPGGPLGILFGGAAGLEKLQYPRDLGTNTKGHVVKFTINEIEPVNYTDSKAWQGLESVASSLTNGGSGAIEGIMDVGSGVADTVGTALSEAGTTINGGGSIKDAYDLVLDKRKKKTKTIIDLYMPDTVNFGYNATWGESSLVNTLVGAGQAVGGAIGTGLAAAGSAVAGKGRLGAYIAGGARMVGAGVSGLTNGVAGVLGNGNGSNGAKVALSTQGLALNPQEMLLFDGITFRDYQLAFTFTPYSREEAKTVTQIIRQFRLAAAPKVVEGSGGMLFVPPSTLNLQFLLNGKKNPHVTMVEESVITSIDVNYAPNGWAAHNDGAPVQTTLTMNFREIRIIDKTKISQGY